MNQCSVGLVLKSDCHQNKDSQQKQGLISVQSLNNEDQQLLKIRLEVESNVLDTLCVFHKHKYIDYYTASYKTCCDMFQVHKKPVRNSSLRIISLGWYHKVKCHQKNLNIIPGRKVCSNCRKKAEELIQEVQSSCSEVEEIEMNIETEESLSSVNESLHEIGESPIKFHGIPSCSKTTYGKRKLKQINQTFRSEFAKVLKVDTLALPSQDENIEDSDNSDQISFQNMITKIKEKIESSNSTRADKIQVLTMAPNNWSRKKAAEVFNVSERMVRQAQNLEKTSGVFSRPQPRKGKSLTDHTIQKITQFYQNNENCRIMPGIKDRVSIKKNQHEQKRLLLCTLKELYLLFKKQNPEDKIGFSKFCTLRPKWCVGAGSSGTHSVCVCTIHQNVVLLLHAAQIEESYKDLIKLAVCDAVNKDCMLQRCSHCPGIEAVEEKLKEKFEDTDEEINFKQWVSVDRTELVSQLLPVSEFLQLLISKIAVLIPHHFISHSQSVYLRKRKETMVENTAIILMDFAENYSFYIQDEVQGYHWTHKACTVHPVVCYYKNNQNELVHASICFLSEEMQHDVIMVYFIQKSVVAFLKTKIPDLSSVEYFTDGCAAQYKNRKSFYNLCQHKNDFNVDAMWSFFATSHGKSPCDGIGGTVKRSTAMESLRRPLSGQITDIEPMMDYCTQKLPNIKFIHISKNDLNDIRPTLHERFTKASTIKGTRGFHYFEPMNSNKLGMKRISDDAAFSLIVELQPDQQPYLDICESQFVCAVYDHKWYIGMAKEIDRSNNDLLLEFMHPNGPSPSFHWPQQSDVCWVPLQHVLCQIEIPTLDTIRGQYHLSNHAKDKITSAWMHFLKH